MNESIILDCKIYFFYVPILSVKRFFIYICGNKIVLCWPKYFSEKIILLIALFFVSNSWFAQDDSLKKTINKDSLMLNYSRMMKDKIQSSTKKMSSNDSLFSSINNYRDSLMSSVSKKVKEELKKSKLTGEVHFFEKYGLLADFIDTTPQDPLNVYGSRGELKLKSFSIPVKLNYQYLSYKNPVGVNNFFRVSYDLESLKSQKPDLDSSMLQKKINAQQNVNTNLKNELVSSISFSEILENKLKEEILAQKAKLLDEEQLINACNDTTQQYNCDSLNHVYQQRRNNIDSLQQQLDTVLYYKQQTQDLLDDIEATNSTLSEKKQQLSNLNTEFLHSKVADKVKGLMGNFSKFSIGLSSPQSSGLTSNSVPMKGVHFEIDKPTYYLSFASGFLMNNLFVTNDKIANATQNASNLFNQFDFQVIKANTFATFIKTGIGSKNATHLHVGLNYVSIPEKDRRNPILSTEIEAVFQPKKFDQFRAELVVGKTSKYDTISINNRFNEAINSLLDKSNLATFGQVKMKWQVKKVNSEIEVAYRYLGVDASTKAFGVLQPDNKRLELKSRHKLSRSSSILFQYRYDQNNTSRTIDSTNQLFQYGAQLNSILFKRISLTSNIVFVDQKSVQVLGNTQRKITSNYQLGNTLSYSFTIQKKQQQLQLQQQLFKLSFDNLLTEFENYSITFISLLKNGKLKNNASYFEERNVSLDSVNTAYILGSEYQFKFKKLSVIASASVSVSNLAGTQPGFKLLINYPFLKSFALSLQAERLVYGNFYSYYTIDQFKNFPYMGQVRLNYIFK